MSFPITHLRFCTLALGVIAEPLPQGDYMWLDSVLNASITYSDLPEAEGLAWAKKMAVALHHQLRR